MKIQLIHCPEKPTGMIEGAWYPPLNLISIATHLRHYNADCCVEILDGQLLTTEEIGEKINADIVGFDLMHSSIESFDVLVEIAKSCGAITIVGGHLATHLAKEILQENPNVDYVCRLGGEEALSALARGKVHSNLAYRKNGIIYVPSWRDLKPVNLKNLLMPNRKITGIDLEKYVINFNMQKTKLKLPYSRTTNTYFSRGCPYRIHGDGCSFCSRADSKMSCRSPEQIWKEIDYLVKNFNIECVADFSDTFISIIRPLTKYIEKHGRPWKFLRVYMAVNEISFDTIKLLKKLGIITVLLGIESGDEEVLRQNVDHRKIHKPDFVIEACKALAKAGIMVAPAYVLGMKGENEKSLQKTLRLNDNLQKIGNTEITYSNIITPFPGTKAFNDLKISTKNLKETYHFQIDEIQKRYVENFTSISWNVLQEVRIELGKKSSICSFEFTSPSL